MCDSLANVGPLNSAGRAMRQLQVLGCLIMLIAIPCQTYFGYGTVRAKDTPTYQYDHSLSYHAEDAIFLALQL
jgi:hypothetical protein